MATGWVHEGTVLDQIKDTITACQSAKAPSVACSVGMIFPKRGARPCLAPGPA
jgi:hypothetical protein